MKTTVEQLAEKAKKLAENDFVEPVPIKLEGCDEAIVGMCRYWNAIPNEVFIYDLTKMPCGKTIDNVTMSEGTEKPLIVALPAGAGKLTMDMIRDKDHSTPIYIFPPEFDKAVIGMVGSEGSDGRLQSPVIIYDAEKCIEVYMEREGWDYEEAMEWLTFNDEGAWVGQGTPIFAWHYYEEYL